MARSSRKVVLETRSSDELYNELERLREPSYSDITPVPSGFKAGMPWETLWHSQGIAIHVAPEQENSLKIDCVLSMATHQGSASCDVAAITASPRKLDETLNLLKQVAQQLALLRSSGWTLSHSVDRLYHHVHFHAINPISSEKIDLKENNSPTSSIARSRWALRNIGRRLGKIPSDPVLQVMRLKQKQMQTQPQLNWRANFEQVTQNQKEKLTSGDESYQSQLIAARFKNLDGLSLQLFLEQVTPEDLVEKTLFELMEQYQQDRIPQLEQ